MGHIKQIMCSRKTVPLFILQIIAAIAIVLMLKPIVSDIVYKPTIFPANVDFMAFYCGAKVAVAHKDPYALGPLQACETEIALDSTGVTRDSNINPDPMPGYSMALFAPFTILSYHAAAIVWDMLLIASIIGTAIILTILTDIPFLIITLIFMFLGTLGIGLGQIPPLFTFGLALTAYGLVKNKISLSLIGAALSMLEPHVGLPTCIALFVWRPNLRLGLISVGVALGAISIVTLGLPLNIEYLATALPAQVQAEGTTTTQYSLTWLLHYFGVADNIAIKIASIQYVIFSIISIIYAGPIAKKFNTSAALVLFPPVIVLIGGSYIHLYQMMAAIPFALLIVSRLRGSAAYLTWFALLLMALSWSIGSRLFILEASIIIIVIVFMALRNQRMIISGGIVMVSIVIYLIFAGPLLQHVIPTVPQRWMVNLKPMPRALNGDYLASEEDAREERQDKSITTFACSTPRTLATKLPIWFALCIIVIVGLNTHNLRTKKVNFEAVVPEMKKSQIAELEFGRFC